MYPFKLWLIGGIKGKDLNTLSYLTATKAMLDIGCQTFKSLLNQGLKKGKGHARLDSMAFTSST
jgi:hypothetical protein